MTDINNNPAVLMRRAADELARLDPASGLVRQLRQVASDTSWSAESHRAQIRAHEARIVELRKLLALPPEQRAAQMTEQTWDAAFPVPAAAETRMVPTAPTPAMLRAIIGCKTEEDAVLGWQTALQVAPILAVPDAQPVANEREAFEAWAATQADTWLIVGGLTWSPGTNDYASARTNAAFAAWQARAALAAPQPAVELDSWLLHVMAALREAAAMVDMLEAGEWAEQVGKTPLGARLEAAITKLHNEIHAARDESESLVAQPSGQWVVEPDITDAPDAVLTPAGKSLRARQAQAPAAQGDALDRECWAIGRAINRAAADLPEGWEIRIDLERNAGTVHLTPPEGAETMIDAGGEHFSSHINMAIDAALKENSK